ncbi:hypothetical protein J5N97_021388 [Dioscorea zingiberensis]|uniref:Root cap n=1 Tax=Dioscorea zingiberensis TaxID=325984 RepID=A0A9D5HEA8_9LILI|nr:hypothetical protein J5N97_021388 [Dioscorea zingiberensis]
MAQSQRLLVLLLCFILLLVLAKAIENDDHGEKGGKNGGENNNDGGDNIGNGGKNNGGGNDNDDGKDDKGDKGGSKGKGGDDNGEGNNGNEHNGGDNKGGDDNGGGNDNGGDCNKPGGVCQDPRFVGGDGITFYFHGKKDRDFCLLSDSHLHINAHFIGRRNAEMNRDFTWVQSIALLFNDHKLYVGAQKTATWNNDVDRLMISLDEEQVLIPTEQGAKWQTPTVTITRSSDANAVTVEVEGVFKVQANVVPITEEESRVHRYGLTADDCFAHLELAFKFYSLTQEVDGVLGQTYRENYVSRVKLASNMPVMGGVEKFSTSGIYAADCTVARFNAGGGGVGLVTELADVIKCGSEVDGHGIICKR